MKALDFQLEEIHISKSISHFLKSLDFYSGWALHPPHPDAKFPLSFFPREYLLLPRDVRSAVEDDEMPFLGAHATQVVAGLRQALLDGCLQGFVQEIEFDDGPLHRAVKSV